LVCFWGGVFTWFGVIKLVGLSPVIDLAGKTMHWLSLERYLPLLGWWEVVVGMCFLYGPLIRVALLLLFFQMPGTMLPLFLFPEICFSHLPFGLSLEGQYIIKNYFLISAACTLVSRARTI
jgi:uncharacterized membrane protein YkgB